MFLLTAGNKKGIRKVVKSDHEQLKTWWKKRNGSAVSEDIWSDTGFIADDLAAVFYYPVKKCPWAIVWSPISNPDSDKEKRQNALNMLYKRVETEAKRDGYKMLLTMTSIDPVEKLVTSLGYKPGDKKINQYVKVF